MGAEGYNYLLLLALLPRTERKKTTNNLNVRKLFFWVKLFFKEGKKCNYCSRYNILWPRNKKIRITNPPRSEEIL